MSSKDRSTSSSQDQSDPIKPEFSHRVPLAQIRRDIQVDLAASAEEREKLCHRFGLLSLERLEGQFRLSPGEGQAIMAEGKIRAKAMQPCVITGEPVEEQLEETFLLRFLPRDEIVDDDTLDLETLLAEEADDVPYDGHAIDVGEALAEQLALCLTPYPRLEGSGLDAFVEVTPTEEEEEAPKMEKPNPFAALAQLKEKKH